MRLPFALGATAIAVGAAWVTFAAVPPSLPDFAKDLKFDKACVVKAFSSTGDVYLECKGSETRIKSSVDVPDASTLLVSALKLQRGIDTAEQLATQKRAAQARVIWDILYFSFSNQAEVLLTFKPGTITIADAVAYVQPGLEERIKSRNKIDL